MLAKQATQRTKQATFDAQRVFLNSLFGDLIDIISNTYGVIYSLEAKPETIKLKFDLWAEGISVH